MKAYKFVLLAALACIAVTQTSSAALMGQLGILDTSGINPATGQQWALGDTYRLVFVSSATTDATSTDITTYNSFIQNLANAAGLGDATWTAIGSTETVNAQNNTGTNPVANGVGEAIILMDGSTIIADNYADLWDGGIEVTILGGGDYLSDPPRGIHLDEYGITIGADDRIFTGTSS